MLFERWDVSTSDPWIYCDFEWFRLFLANAELRFPGLARLLSRGVVSTTVEELPRRRTGFLLLLAIEDFY